MSRRGGMAVIAASIGISAAPPCAGSQREEPVWGGLSWYDIQVVVRARRPSVRRACFERALRSRPQGSPAGARVVAEVDIEPTGKVRSVAITSAESAAYPALGKCVASQVRTWQFPRSVARLRTSVPFLFEEKDVPEDRLPPKPPIAEPHTATTLAPVVSMLTSMAVGRCLPDGQTAPTGEAVVTVAGSGKVTRVALRGASRPGRSMAACISRELTEGRVPIRSFTPITVTVPLSTNGGADNLPARAFDTAAAARASGLAADEAGTLCKTPHGATTTVRVLFTLAPSGTVTRVQLAGGALAGNDLACIERTFGKAKIPPFDGEPVTISKGVTLK